MSANDYYSGGGGGGQQQSHYGSGTGSSYPAAGDNSGGNNQPFSPPPTIYTPDSSTQHSPYPGSAQPSYDQQNVNAGYGGGGHSPRPDYSYGGSPYPPQQDYGRPHSPYEQQGQNQGQGQGYGYGGYQGSYDQGQSYNASNDYASRFGGSTYGNSPQPSHASPAYGGAPPSYSQQDSYYNSNQQPPPGQYAQPGDPANPGDKGILGALGGAAVGGYAGHQVNHGFLGAVGGAITGSVAEDAWKKKNKKDKKDKKDKNKWGRRNSSSSSSSSSSSDDDKKKKKKHGAAAAGAAAGALRGNFSASSRGVELHGTELVAWCNPVHGGPRRSALNLNSVLSNQHGNFMWARGGNFGASARKIRLVEGGRVLEAELGNGSGGWNRGWVRLDERITNDNGNLRFLD